jgi:hypothetical protein
VAKKSEPSMVKNKSRLAGLSQKDGPDMYDVSKVQVPRFPVISMCQVYVPSQASNGWNAAYPVVDVSCEWLLGGVWAVLSA